MHYQATSYHFRGWGVLLGLAFHLAMFAWAFTSENALAGGYRFLFTWYLPSIILGLPWSIPAMFLDAFVPDLGILGLAAAVCCNGYLLGWLLDAIINHGRRTRPREFPASLRAEALTMDQLLASEAAMTQHSGRSAPE